MQALSDGKIKPTESQRLMACTKVYIDVEELRQARKSNKLITSRTL